MSTTNKNIVYGDQDVLPGVEFNPKDAKVRISIMVDGDLLDSYKQEADRLHTKYQTLMNQKLREALTGKGDSNLETRVEILERAILREVGEAFRLDPQGKLKAYLTRSKIRSSRSAKASKRIKKELRKTGT